MGATNRLLATSAVLTFFMLATFATAQSTGVEAITFSTNSVTLVRGNATAVNFTVSKVSGYYNFATTVSVANQSITSSNNIITLLLNNTGNPPFMGTLHIFTAPNATVGTYTITLVGSGSSAQVKAGTLLLNVTASKPVPTSSVATSQATTQMSTVPATTAAQTTASYVTSAPQSSSPSGSQAAYIVVAIIVIVVIAALAYLSMARGKHKKK